MKFSTILSSLVIIIVLLATLPVSAADNATISIPSINVNVPIVPVYVRAFPDGSVTWDVSGLRMSVGYLDGTAWFGTGGNVVLGGHSELARGQADVFYYLDQVQPGAEIIVTIGETVRRYTVTSVSRVNENDLTPVYPTTYEQLTLITCDVGSYNASTGLYSDRLVLVAVPVG